MLSNSLEPSPLEFLQAVEAGQDVREALRTWHKRRTGALRIVELKKQLSQPEERQSSGSLRSTAVMRAIAAEREARKKRLQRVRLLPLEPIEEPPTRLISTMPPGIGYSVVIERERPFLLEITDNENGTLHLMEIACRGCYQTKKRWPTCILVRKERFYRLEYNLRWFAIEDVSIPFDCAPDEAKYDVMAMYDVVGQEDAWTKDRKNG